MDPIGTLGMAADYSALQTVNVQQAASTSMLSKAMEADNQAVSQLLNGLSDFSARSAMELSVNPAIGSNFNAAV